MIRRQREYINGGPCECAGRFPVEPDSVVGLRVFVSSRRNVPLVAALLLCLGTSQGAPGVRAPVLLPEYPFDYSFSPFFQLYAPSTRVVLKPSLLGRFLSWRIYWGASPAGSSRAAESSVLVERLMTFSTLRAWRQSNATGAIRTSRETGSLLPTIYLPLDMPPILARTIGEGGQLDISGQQRISLSGITHYRPNAVQTEGQSPSLFPDLKMEQQLQVQLNGTIGEKIHVDVDHDSERSMQPESRIRLAYEGWEDEIVQSIEVGDVSLAITGPEFVSYSIPHEGLFGAKVLAQAGPLDFTTIASKEASSTESADFVGQATMFADSILDIYPADNYFFRPCPDTISPPVISRIRIFTDNLDASDNDETGAVQGDWFVVSGGDTLPQGTGFWDELIPGPDQDFVLTDSSRTIQFNMPVNDNYVVAVWVLTEAGSTFGDTTTGAWNLMGIKESNPLPAYPTWSYEMRNRYFLGSNNIVQESFQCVICLARPGEDPVSTQEGTPFIQLLGLDTNGDGSLSDEEHAVDWENGFLVFPEPRPFSSDTLIEKNELIYTERNPDPTDSKYFLAVSYRAASTTYSLGNIGIVPGSEVVTLTAAGVSRTLVRDTDYTIIYEIGLLSLMGEAAEQAQDPANTLRVTYEYLPFMASQSRTLFGSRAVYNLGQGTWLGATAMYESSRTSEGRPRVGEESTRTLVTDVDARYEMNPGFLTSFANSIPGINTDARSSIVLSGEVAASFPDPNTSNRAYIDDMEGTESAYPPGQSRLAWSFGSIPVSGSPLLRPVGFMKWYNVTDRWLMEDIVPGVTGDQAKDRVQSVLELVFDPLDGNPARWGSIQRCIDRYGLDFSTKTRLRLYVRATGSAQDAQLCLDLGERIDEDSWWLERTGGVLERRANGELDTEDRDGNGTLSDDEDTGLDGLFDPDEDPGSPDPDPNRDNYEFNPSLPPAQRFLHVNGTEGNAPRLDTEDLNSNGILDRSNSFFRVRIPLNDPAYIISGPNDEGWMLLEIPLSDSTLVTVPDVSGSPPTWEKISYARLWVEGFTARDTIDVYDLAIVGNRWLQRAVTPSDSISPPVFPGEELIISTVNNKDNGDYAAEPPPGIDPGRDDNGDVRLEQSIAVEAVSIAPGHEGRACQVYYDSEDYTGYSTFRFPVHGSDDASGEFFLRMGRDSLNYYEVSMELTPGWHLVETAFEDLTRLKILKNERGLEYLRQGGLAVLGSPNLADIQELAVGIRNRTAAPLSTIAWVDDITLHGAYSGVDIARRLTGSIDLADLATLTGDYRSIGADFHGLGQRSGQGTTTTSYSSGLILNLDRFAPPLWSLSVPATLAWNRDTSEPRFQPGSDLRLEGAEAWANRTETDAWDTSVNWRRSRRSEEGLGRYLFDPWDLRHTFSTGTGLSPGYRDSTQTAMGEVVYDLSMTHRPMFSLPVLGGLSFLPTRTMWSVKRQNLWDTRWELTDEDTVQTRATTGRTLGTEGTVAFNFWQGQSSTMSLGLNRDLLYPWMGGAPFNIGRETSRNQTASVAQDINLWDYLFPRLSFDAAYGSSRLAPHTSSGEDSLGSPDVSLSTTRRLNLRIGLVQAIRSIARLRDERQDESASPGSPRWLLMKLERWANNITDPTVVVSRTIGSEYNDLGYYPGYAYRFGLQTELAGVVAYDRTRSDNLQISGGFRPLSSMSVRTEYSSTDTRHLYSGYWNRQLSRTWPSVSVSMTGLERLAPFANLLRSGSLSTGYRIEKTESGRFEQGDYIPTSSTTSDKWSPLFNITAGLRNKVQISLSDNYSITETRNFTGTLARTRSTSSSIQLNIQYAFSAPGGLAIPLPLLDKLRISFQSDLTTALAITRSRMKTEIIAPGFENQLQSDREEWRIEPSANYDFGTVTAGLTAIYGWKKDRVNSVYDQRDIGMDVWVMINF
jgi:hypothetical protein